MLTERASLLDLDGNNPVLSCAVEELYGSTVSCALDVCLVGTCLGEEVNDSLNTLLGELLVALCGTGLLVSITIDNELGVTVDNVVGEVLEVSLFTCAEGSGTTVEVEGDRSTGGCINSGEGAIVIQISLTVYELTERSNFLLEGSNFVLEFGVLFLEFSNLTGEVFILLGGEGHGNNCRNNACAALEALLSKLVSYTPSDGGGEGNLCRETSTGIIPIVTFLIGSCKEASVDNHIEVLIAKECILLCHCTKTKNPRVIQAAVADYNTETGGRIADEAPFAGFLVTINKRADVKEVIQNEVLGPFGEFLNREAMPSKTETHFRGDPLTYISIQTKTRPYEERNCGCLVTSVDTVVNADTATDKPVVAPGIGLIGTTHNVTVGVAVCILLSVAAH